MEMEYDMAIKIMDAVVKDYLRDMGGMLRQVGATTEEHETVVAEVYMAYSRIRNG